MKRGRRRDSDIPEPSRRALRLWALLPHAVFLLLWLVTFRRWVLPFADSGREMNTAWRVASGEGRYWDVGWSYGPLAPLVDAALLRVFGRNLDVIGAWRTLLGVLGVELLRRLARRLAADAASASAITAFAVAACAFGVGGSWPEGHLDAGVTESTALGVGLLLLLAAAGKSALVPFSGWLPRAMEGPTPSSAVFYGALSVHLGAFLLLRVSPLIEHSAWLAAAVITLGLTTALFAYVCGSVQTDIKSALSFASLTQVGIIVVEIGFGLRYIALIHLLGHACLRTLQFVRAPSLLYDYRTLENAIGNRLPRLPGPWGRFVPAGVSLWFYRLALERGYWDILLNEFIVVPYMRLFTFFDSLERWWTGLLSGWASRESDELKPYSGQIEDLP